MGYTAVAFSFRRRFLRFWQQTEKTVAKRYEQATVYLPILGNGFPLATENNRCLKYNKGATFYRQHILNGC
jgi:hypothetical protein